MGEAVNDDGVPPELGIKLRQPAELQKLLGFLQRSAQTDAKTEQPAAGGVAPAGKDLVQIDVAHAGALGQRSLGKAAFFEQLVELLSCMSYSHLYK